MSTLTFRPAGADDAPQILEIYTPYILETAITFEVVVPNKQEYEARLSHITSRFPYLVCEDGDGLAGYAYADEQYERAAYQWNASLSIYMRQDSHGRGVGKRLYGALMEILECMGYRNLYALISLPNEASIALHEKYGFRESGLLRKTGYKFGVWHDVVILEKQLGELLPDPPAPLAIQDMPPSQIREILAKWQPEK